MSKQCSSLTSASRSCLVFLPWPPLIMDFSLYVKINTFFSKLLLVMYGVYYSKGSKRDGHEHLVVRGKILWLKLETTAIDSSLEHVFPIQSCCFGKIRSLSLVDPTCQKEITGGRHLKGIF